MSENLEKILDEAAINAPPTFHPIHERSAEAWFPGNEAASLLIQISHTWEDILRLAEMRKSEPDQYNKKLLFKYILGELRSIIVLLSALQKVVMEAPTFDPVAEDPPWRSISPEEKETAKKLFKQYHNARRKVESRLITIRNKIVAHRGLQPWNEIMEMWDQLTPEPFQDIFSRIPPVFNHVKDLDLYDWNRSPDKGTIEILGGQIYLES